MLLLNTRPWLPSPFRDAEMTAERPTFEHEAHWLRARVIRLRAALRFTQEPRVDVILREVIGDAEDRLAALDQRPVLPALPPRRKT